MHSKKAAFAALIAAACFAAPTYAGPEVTVVNTSAQPIPATIQGTVTVTGTTTLDGLIGIYADPPSAKPLWYREGQDSAVTAHERAEGWGTFNTSSKASS